MRIAQISTPHIPTPPAGYGGCERIAGYLAEGLVRRGHQVTLFGAAGSTAPADEVRTFPRAAEPAEFDHRELTHVALSLREASRFDVIHNHCLTAGPALAGLVERPCLTTLHYVHPIVRAFPEHPYVAVSECQRRSLPELRFAGVVHNAVDPTAHTFRAVKGDYLLFLGRFHPNKGPHIAIEVARRLGERLIIAAPAPHPDQEPYFEEQVRPGLGGRIEWIGPVEGAEKDRLLGEARCVVLPVCWDEPFGLVYLEAMASGTPVVTFRRGAAPEVVAHGRTGYVVDTVEEMVAAVPLAAGLRPESCRRHVEVSFGVDRMVEDYLEVYRRLLGADAT